MLEHVEIMFEDMGDMLKWLKKKSYEQNMERFRSKYSYFFQEMTEYLDKTEEKDKGAAEIAESFVSQVEKFFSAKGRIKSRIQADMNFFMIYYVFPSILMTGHDEAGRIADKICEKWGSTFKDSKIGYTTYEDLYNGFNDKIFGIFSVKG